MGRTNMRYPYPEAGGISQPQRAAGQPLPFTTEKHAGSGIEPGVSDCEATVFPRRHCTPLSLLHLHLGMARHHDPRTKGDFRNTGETEGMVPGPQSDTRSFFFLMFWLYEVHCCTAVEGCT